MTLLEVEELVGYWSGHPPVHMLLAAYLGIGGSQKQRKSPAPGRADLGSLVAELGPGFAAGDVHAGLARVALDFAELKRRASSDK